MDNTILPVHPLSSLSCFTVASTVKGVGVEILNEPSFLVLNSVPPLVMENFHTELKKINSTLNQHVVDAALHWVLKYKYDAHLHQQRVQYLETLDSIRGTQLAKNYE